MPEVAIFEAKKVVDVCLDVLLELGAALWRDSLPEGVELEDAGQEDGERHHGDAHRVDDDALRHELGVLVADRLDGHHRVARQRAGQLTASAGTKVSRKSWKKILQNIFDKKLLILFFY